MSRRPARCTQADMRRAIAAAEKEGARVSVDILPDGTIRFTPTSELSTTGKADEKPRKGGIIL